MLEAFEYPALSGLITNVQRDLDALKLSTISNAHKQYAIHKKVSSHILNDLDNTVDKPYSQLAQESVHFISAY
jgi:hypothetical protein